MPLESLSNEQINIHDLTLEQEKKPEPEAKKLYKDLKETPLYNHEKERWVHSMGDLYGSETFYTEDQLLGIWAESMFDKLAAKNDYEKLRQDYKDAYLLDNEDSYWFNREKTGSFDAPESRNAEDQLIDVLAMANFNKEKAQKRFVFLKRHPFYYSPVKTWFPTLNRQGKVSGFSELKTSIIGILAEAQFNKDEASENWNNLKLADKRDYLENNLWHSDFSGTKRCYGSFEQLLSVLAEANFNKEDAKKQYNKLKDTELYNPDTKLWKRNIGEDIYDSKTQLVNFACMSKLEENKTFNASTPPLPETKKY